MMASPMKKTNRELEEKNSRETFPDGNSKMQEEIKSNENRNYVVKPL